MFDPTVHLLAVVVAEGNGPLPVGRIKAERARRDETVRLLHDDR